MGKFRKSQKIRQKNKELTENRNEKIQTPFSEMAVDVPRVLRGDSVLKEQNYQPPGPDRYDGVKNMTDPTPKEPVSIRSEKQKSDMPEKMSDLKAGNSHSLPAHRKCSKSAANTPKTVRRDQQTDFRFSRSRSLPHRRVKNFVPFDV